MSKQSYFKYLLFSYAKAYSEWVILEFRSMQDLQQATNRYCAYSMISSWQAVKFPIHFLVFVFNNDAFHIDFESIMA